MDGTTRQAGRSVHYIDNKEFLREMIEFRESIKDLPEGTRPKIPDPIARKIMKICERLSYSRDFIASPHREEMILDAIENCVVYIGNFDAEKSSNPFSYFTQIAYYAFIRRAQKETRQLVSKMQFAKSMLQLDILGGPSDSKDTEGLTENSVAIKRILDFEEFKPDPNRVKRTTLAHKKKMDEKAAADLLDLDLEDLPDEGDLTMEDLFE